LGQHFSRFFTPEDVAAGKPARELEIAQIRGRFEEESWRVRKDGTRFWANVVITPIRDAANSLVGFVKITRDLTEQRNAQEDRVRLAQAQEAIRLRDDFLSIASHELKTPLTALQLQLRSIRSQVGDGGGRLADTANRAMRVAERLANLIEALLDVSRITTGRLKLSFEAFDLVEVAREVIERLRESAADAGCVVSLEGRGPIEGRWDRLRIEQVLTNLLSNALKYAARKPIVVSVARAGHEAVLQVRDDGPGITEHQMPRLFERFERADSSRNYGGMGLGLYVAREIAQAHGGTIAANNLPAGGASFTVRLPLDPQATTSHA
jgi:signal transduction histidine kinase